MLRLRPQKVRRLGSRNGRVKDYVESRPKYSATQVYTSVPHNQAPWHQIMTSNCTRANHHPSIPSTSTFSRPTTPPIPRQEHTQPTKDPSSLPHPIPVPSQTATKATMLRTIATKAARPVAMPLRATFATTARAMGEGDTGAPPRTGGQGYVDPRRRSRETVPSTGRRGPRTSELTRTKQ